MATAEQLKSLIRSHLDNDRERFLTTALQLAAHEARMGHSSVAEDIRFLVDKAKSNKTRVVQTHRELDELVATSEPHLRISDLIVTASLQERIQRIKREYHQQTKLKKHGLRNRRKILLMGPPGTGKTMTAAALAGELSLPLYTILMERIITKFMGETSAKLRQIFDVLAEHRGVYLFDEFDAIGAERSRDDDVGEMRRVLNSFLQFLEQDDSDSLIVAITNNPRILDQALFRRFDDVLHYSLPTRHEIGQLIASRLGAFADNDFASVALLEEAASLSHAEITQACDDAIKEAILSDKEKITEGLLQNMLGERRQVYRVSASNKEQE